MTIVVKSGFSGSIVSVVMTLFRYPISDQPPTALDLWPQEEDSHMNATLIASLAAMFAALTTLVIAIIHWQRTHSNQQAWILKQQQEIDRLVRNRSDLARKFFRQLRQARLYSRLEDEFCLRLAEHSDAAPETIKKSIRRHVEDELGDGIRHNHRYAKESGIQDQIDWIHEMGFETDGESIMAIASSTPVSGPMIAA